jgi:putative oxidoreductase
LLYWPEFLFYQPKSNQTMKALLNLGRFLFALPFLLFGVFHFMSADQMAGMVPFPGGVIWVYVTGLALVAAAVSMLLGRMDKLATLLLGVMLLIFALSIHLPNVMEGSDPAAMPSMLKDIMLAGAAWMYAGHVARDKSVVG